MLFSLCCFSACDSRLGYLMAIHGVEHAGRHMNCTRLIPKGSQVNSNVIPNWFQPHPKVTIKSEVFRKQQNSIPKCSKNDSHERSFFAILCMREPRLGSPKRRNVDSEIVNKMTWKQARQKQNDFLTFWSPKTGINKSQN